MQSVKLPGVILDDVLMRLGGDETQAFALSSSGDGGWGNTLGWNPIAVFKPKVSSAKEVALQLDDFVRQQQEMDRLVIGYETYDFGCLLHDVPTTNVDELNMPLVLAASFDSWLTFDKTGAVIHSSGQHFGSLLKQIMKRPARLLPKEAYKKDLSPTQTRGWYSQAYNRIKSYIKAGDVYQVNLTHQLVGSTEVTGRDLFCLLHKISQADFQAFIEIEDLEILSFSPERFVKVDGRSIETSPIKGTRERGSTIAKDDALRADLLTNSKDRAELNMITDLLRNDLGQICEVGSVEVTEARVLKAYPTLWHTHSTIKGRLESSISPIAALSSMMPGGSITGCPKKRAIEIIDELEATRRGLYTGSIFINRADGTLDSSIAIRTMIKKGHELYLSVGGGIVNDSVEADEYQESLDKAASFIGASSKTPELSSDILENQFGLTEIEVLYQDKSVRVISTKALDTDKVLELSMVEFIKSGVDAFPEVHRDVLSGQSMGKAFRARGIKFVRRVESSYPYALPSKYNNRFGVAGPSSVVNVTVLVGQSQTPYVQIFETYSPEVMWDTRDGEPTDEDQKKIQRLGKFI